MSAFRGKADINTRVFEVRFVPETDIVNIGNDQLARFLERVQC